jgi:8-oxo-dGTP pyrophosphatase MutT (NUDIX family)
MALRRLIEERLQDTRPATDPRAARPAGVALDLQPLVRKYFPPTLTAAAVLVPIIEHRDGLTVLFTQRATHLKHHAGQVSFPGGRIEATDASPRDAALRETEEEIGLEREFVNVVGYLDPHLTMTGFWITPVVAIVRPGFALRPDPTEVESVFEVPLAHILDSANHRARAWPIGEFTAQIYEIPYQDRNVWGATAGMLMSLYRLLTVATAQGST